MIGKILIFFLRLYRWTLSPFLQFVAGPGAGCRFDPSCSVYAIQAVQEHGAWRGTVLSACRLCRCHPWGGMGYDPVPPRFSSPSRSPQSAQEFSCVGCTIPQSKQTSNFN